MSKKKFYAVKVGRNPGIYLSWKECEEQIKGFSGQEYKSFSNQEDAICYLNNDEICMDIDKKPDNVKTQEEIDEIIKKCLNSDRVVAFTDGGYKGKEKIYGYGIYIIAPNEEKPVEICDIVRTEQFHNSNNIGPEVMAVINALDWALSNEYDKITVFYDYEGIGKWANNEWDASSEIANQLMKHKLN